MPMAERRPAPVPAVLVSGFLGAGKTTLLNGVLARLAGRRVAIVENEVGDEPLDGDLLNAPREQIVELAGGCLCCTVQGQLAEALGALAARAGDLDLLLVETSGVADPAPVIRAFQAQSVRDAFRLRALVTVVDAVNSVACADLVPAAWEAQVRWADELVLNKADLLGAEDLAVVEARLRRRNPTATLHRAVRADAGVEAVLRAASAAGEDRTGDLPAADPPRAAAKGDEGGAHGFTSVAISESGDVDPERLETWLGGLVAARRMDVLRIKGVLALEGEPRRYVVQGVRALRDGELGEPWRGPRRSRLVIIGRRLDAHALRAGFRACRTAAAAA
ncbi:MAG: GTP-binding protein [Solirubrobacteraceae bacterium MAG38_C4-C5]|nr:GTP-binding protein [Candidatus Siliceabacter maunaloa]